MGMAHKREHACSGLATDQQEKAMKYVVGIQRCEKNQHSNNEKAFMK